MSSLLILAAAGATAAVGSITQLQAEQAEELGISISAVNMQVAHQHPYPLYNFEVNLTGFSQCEVRGLFVQLFDDAGQVIYSSSIVRESESYHFQIQQEYLDTSIVGFGCDAGPEVIDPVYTVSLGEYEQRTQQD